MEMILSVGEVEIKRMRERERQRETESGRLGAEMTHKKQLCNAQIVQTLWVVGIVGGKAVEASQGEWEETEISEYKQ